MTDHPLTDETCRQLWQDSKGTITDWQDPGTMTRQVMRAAADWQLEQVIKWITKNAMKHDPYQRFLYFTDPDYSAKALANELTCDLKKAMRPTTPTQEDNPND